MGASRTTAASHSLTVGLWNGSVLALPQRFVLPDRATLRAVLGDFNVFAMLLCVGIWSSPERKTLTPTLSQSTGRGGREERGTPASPCRGGAVVAGAGSGAVGGLARAGVGGGVAGRGGVLRAGGARGFAQRDLHHLVDVLHEVELERLLHLVGD